MVDDQDGSSLVAKRLEAFQDFPGAGRVQVREGLVQEEAAAFHGIEAGQDALLLFAAGEGLQLPVQELFHVEEGGGAPDALVHLFRRNLEIFQAEKHFPAEGVHTVLKIGILEHHAKEPGPSGGRQTFQRRSEKGNASAFQDTAVFREEAPKHQAQGALAAAAAPGENGDFSLGNF